jgi:magnesium transporter
LVAQGFSLNRVSKYLAEPDALVWVDMCNPDHDTLTALADELDLDPHAVEDVVAKAERTKATRYSDHMFLTVYATGLGEIGENLIESRLLTARVSIFVLPGGLVTIRHEIDPQKPVFDVGEVIRRWDDNSDLLRLGAPALLHGVLDVIVDGQFETIQELDDAIESLEEGLFDEHAQPRTIQRNTYRLRKELVELRRIVLPMRDVINTIMRARSEPSGAVGLDSWYSDLYDHVIRAAEWTESLRDMVTTVFETNLSLQDARLNTIMKKLTGWAAIIAVPTAVTGWYGQNVPFPGYGAASGAVTSAGFILVTSILLYVVFKRRGWI